MNLLLDTVVYQRQNIQTKKIETNLYKKPEVNDN